MQKALPNKPTLVGSGGSSALSGDSPAAGYFKQNPGAIAGQAPALPALSNPYQSSVIKNSAVG